MNDTTVNELKAKYLVAIMAQSDEVSSIYDDLCDAKAWGESRWVEINQRQLNIAYEVERGLRGAYKMIFEEDAPQTVYDIKRLVNSL